ncbi:glycoside hydrolase family 43 protein [Reinekea blandensis]|nr:glycoside hydrolase family 43 protein [Reinekea blandensis]
MRHSLMLITSLAILSSCAVFDTSSTMESTATTTNATTEESDSADAVTIGQWPVSGELFTHDPAITVEDGTWYSFYTADGIGLNVSEDGLSWQKTYRPALPWNLIRTMRDDWWTQYVPDYSGTSVWAPDVFQYDGRTYLYYAVSTFGRNHSVIGLASTDSLADNNWVDEGAVLASTADDDFNAIDPNLFEDPETGRLWLAYGSYWSGLKLREVDPETMKPFADSEPVSLASRPGVRHNPIEAPALAYHDGFYYLFASIDRCCADSNSTYKVIVGRSTQVTGPYEDDLGIRMLDGGGNLVWTDRSEGRVQGFGGGQDVFQLDNGDWAMAWHIYNRDRNGYPELAIARLRFMDGWPVISAQH